MSTATDFHDKTHAHVRKRLQALQAHVDLTKSTPNLRVLKQPESNAGKPGQQGEISPDDDPQARHPH